MIHETYALRICKQLSDINKIYSKMMYIKVGELDGLKYLETLEHLRKVPTEGLSPLEKGKVWGGEYMNMWIVGKYTVTENNSGKTLWAIPNTGAYETLFFRNGKPDGNYNSKGDYMGIMHSAQKIADNAKPGDVIDLAFECYAGHFCAGTQPLDNYGVDDPSHGDFKLRFDSVDICVEDTNISSFVMNLTIVLQMATELNGDNYLKYRARTVLEKIHAELPLYPAHYTQEECSTAAAKCNVYMNEILGVHGADKSRGYAGLIGHSHMDTAWLWTVDETIRKCARTYSNVCKLMEEYPEYTFIQSSALHIWWMKTYYPDIYEKIKKYVAEGRYEPNGGVWVECDCNITSGEAMTRQFLYGQRFTRENLNYTSDTFWLPDTFGYNGAIPQIMKECDVDYFCTTKMSWNDLNTFPYSTFTWKGIDGTPVITHLHRIDMCPDVKDIKRNIDDAKSSRGFEGRLIPFGHGDGGGGPTPALLERARRILDVQGLPESHYTTVSKFMHEAEEKADNLPTYRGELYLELHRGTLTQMHDIKRTNRKCEFALHDMDYMNVISGLPKGEDTEELWKALLINQFHDILPGTCYTGVTQRAVKENLETIRRVNENTKQYAQKLLAGSGVTYFNTTSFDRDDLIFADDEGLYPEGCEIQLYTDLYGKKKAIIGDVKISAFGSVSYKLTDTFTEGKPSFTFENGKLETPFASVEFDEAGAFSSYYDKTANRQLRRNGAQPLNTLWCGQDVPRRWDDWDIDYETLNGLTPSRKLRSLEVVSCGKLAIVIRAHHDIGQKSELIQDIIFYANTPKVDFNTLIKWNDKHTLLKVGFDVDILAPTFKSEIQYGHINRPTTENNNTEIAQFEVCNHKWSDISESRYGVAILNDCKYGISVIGSDMRLSLHKGGIRPDVTGDAGDHSVTYSFLPHNSGFSVPSVVKPSYLLNIPTLAYQGKAVDSKPFMSISADNIVCESVKPAEDVANAYVLRLYEAECTYTNTEITVLGSEAYLTNMLEEVKEKLEIINGKVKVSFRPFEVKTLLIKK